MKIFDISFRKKLEGKIVKEIKNFKRKEIMTRYVATKRKISSNIL